MQKVLTKKTPKLTIGYATHNRKDYIVRRLNSLISKSIPNNVEIIVVDNKSTDGSFEAILDLVDGSNIRAYQNNENLGFAGNFIEIIKKATGDYVMWSSDEDEIDIDRIQRLFDWMKGDEFDAIFLNHYRKESTGKLTPLRKNKTRRLGYNDLWECCHLPGIVWNRTAALDNLKDWGELKETYHQLSRYYPNLMLLIRTMPHLRSYFFDGYITYQKDFAKSQHTYKTGMKYYHLNPRWLQHVELLDFISSCIKHEKQSHREKYLFRIGESLNRNLYNYLSESIRQENPYLYSYFSRSCSPIYIIRRWYSIIKLVFKSLFDDPLLAIYRVKKRLKVRYMHNNKL